MLNFFIAKIISGGQTGADRAGLDASLTAGVAHGGWCPRGRLAEDGPIPDQYELIESESPWYATRTEWNVRDSDATLVFSFGPARGGTGATIGYAKRLHRPWLHLMLENLTDQQAEERIMDWLKNMPKQKSLKLDSEFQSKNKNHQNLTLNIAGSRASSSPLIYGRVYEIVLGLLNRQNSNSG